MTLPEVACPNGVKWFAVQAIRKLTFLECLILSCVAAACGMIAMTFEPVEPHYKGKSFRQWLKSYRREPTDEARFVIQERIGAQALPFLLKIFETNRPHPLAALAPAGVAAWLNELPQTDRCDHDELIQSIQILGPRARQMVPELLRFSQDPRNTWLAIDALKWIDSDHEALFQTLLGKTTGPAHKNVANAAVSLATHRGYTNLLGDLLRDPDWNIRAMAYQAALKTALPLEVHQRLLIDSLKDQTRIVANQTLTYLLDNPDEVWLAAPEVRALTNNTCCRTNALMALYMVRLVPRSTITNFFPEGGLQFWAQMARRR